MLLKVGSIGREVRDLQRLLKIKIDGIFGVATSLAVKEFQKENKLKIDGIVGPKTWKLLLAEEKMNIVPTSAPVVEINDLGEPDDDMTIEEVAEKAPTSPYILELINLITKATIHRKITKVIYHCTATPQSATVTSIQNYWKNKLGWKAPGYHILIKADGSWTQLQNFNLPTNGVAGHNSGSIHISYIGGVEGGRAADNRTYEQRQVLEMAYRMIKDKLPQATHHGHYEFSNKACPSFNVEAWIKSIKYE